MTPGIWQILLIVVVILLLFGAGRLPRIMGDIAAGIKSFKKGMKDENGSSEKDDAEPKVIEHSDESSDRPAESKRPANNEDDKNRVPK